MVYIVMLSDAPQYGHNSWISAVFAKEEDALYYCKIQKQLDPDYDYYVREEKVIKTYDKTQRVEDYYEYTFNTEDGFPNEENDFNDDEPVKRIYDKDLVVNWEDFYEYNTCTVYSKNSYQEAKEKAYEEWCKQGKEF